MKAHIPQGEVKRRFKPLEAHYDLSRCLPNCLRTCLNLIVNLWALVALKIRSVPGIAEHAVNGDHGHVVRKVEEQHTKQLFALRQ